MINKKELINSEEFENALNEAANHKKDILTKYKARNKDIFNDFYTVLINSANEEIRSILNIKKSKRTDNQKSILLDFYKTAKDMYNQVQILTVDEHLGEGDKTKIEKIVDKIIPVIDILRYIGNNQLENEFKRRGIEINIINKIEDKHPALKTDTTRESIKDILKTATSIRQTIFDDNNYINEDLFIKKVPTELQYDKEGNNTGLKTGDWSKLVDAKTKLVMAQSDEDKKKAEEKIGDIAAQKQFEVARAELVRDKLTSL